MDVANRRVTELAINAIDPQPGEHLLDAGCGTGAAMAQILDRANCRVSGVDHSHEMLLAAGRRLARRRHGIAADLHWGQLESLPFADASFDAVLALNVLYFADREGQTLSSLRRVLRPGGRLVAYVTHRETMRHWSFAQAGLHQMFDEQEMIDALMAGGFARERICVQAVWVMRSIKGLVAWAER